MTEFVPENDVTMEKNVKEEAMIDNDDGAAADYAVEPPLNKDKKKKKKSTGAFGIFRAALYMLRKRPGETEAKKEMNKEKSKNSNGDWKKLVGSMRPLHVQETPESPMHQPMSPVAEEFFPPPSPVPSSSCGTMSQYASALNLRDLCDDEEYDDKDPDEVFDAITGDDMIDAKAEEFIAQFYRQIQLQNSARYYEQDRGF